MKVWIRPRLAGLIASAQESMSFVCAHLVEELGHLQLLVEGHGGAGALLPVAQGGVEDDHAVLVGTRLTLLALFLGFHNARP